MWTCGDPGVTLFIRRYRTQDSRPCVHLIGKDCPNALRWSSFLMIVSCYTELCRSFVLQFFMQEKRSRLLCKRLCKHTCRDGGPPCTYSQNMQTCGDTGVTLSERRYRTQESGTMYTRKKGLPERIALKLSLGRVGPCKFCKSSYRLGWQEWFVALMKKTFI